MASSYLPRIRPRIALIKRAVRARHAGKGFGRRLELPIAILRHADVPWIGVTIGRFSIFFLGEQAIPALVGRQPKWGLRTVPTTRTSKNKSPTTQGTYERKGSGSCFPALVWRPRLLWLKVIVSYPWNHPSPAEEQQQEGCNQGVNQ